MKETMENTWNKFQKELQEPSLCGACGQYYEENEQGDDAYHAPELCDANDEIKENKTHEELHLAILEDVSNVIAKHLPRFDNNITAETWKLLELFTDETINQLTDPALNCECGYQH
jgi:hypothetical protein